MDAHFQAEGDYLARRGFTYVEDSIRVFHVGNTSYVYISCLKAVVNKMLDQLGCSRKGRLAEGMVHPLLFGIQAMSLEDQTYLRIQVEAPGTQEQLLCARRTLTLAICSWEMGEHEWRLN